MSEAGLDALDAYLRPAGEAPALWCAFDPAWYLARHPEAGEALGEAPDFATVRDWYLAHGQPAGHSPVIWFDEAWYRARYPDIAGALAAGQWRSGFEHYCLEGSAGRSPHWLYDETVYRSLNPDLSDEALAAAGCFNRYDHYLRDGAHGGRTAHLLFDPAIYASGHADDPSLGQLGPYGHALHRLDAGAAEVAWSDYFDPAWYRGFYPGVVRPPWRSALHHYLTNPTPSAFDPLVDFSEAHYLALYPDVAAEIAAGRLRNGYEHFLKAGAAEHRSPAPWIALDHYLATNPDAAAAIERGELRHGFAHLLRVGLAAGASLAPRRDDPRAAAVLALRGRGRLDFTCTEPPRLTAIVTLPDEPGRALLALSALRGEVSGPVELLALTPGGRGAEVAARVPGLRLLADGGRGAALAAATAPLVLLLDAGCQPLPGSIAAGLRRIEAEPSAGAVGGPTLDAAGRLVQAGLALFCDGSVARRLAGAPADSAEADVVHYPDACAGSLLLVRRALLGGLDPSDAEGPLADLALCLAVWEAGWRVVYDPAMAAWCDDPRAARLVPPACGPALAARHQAMLALRPPPGSAPASPLVPAERVLVILPALPEADPALAALVAAGAAVTLYLLDGGPVAPAGLPDTVMLIRGSGADRLDAFLTAHAAEFDRIERR